MTHKDATFQHILIMTWRLTCFIVLCGWLNIGILPKSLSSLWWIEGACGLSEAPWPDGHNFDSYVSCSRPWLKASRSWYGSCYWCSSSSMSMVWFWRKVFGTVAQMTKRHWCVGNLVTCSPPKWPCIKSFTADCCGVSFGMNCKKWRGTSRIVFLSYVVFALMVFLESMLVQFSTCSFLYLFVHIVSFNPQWRSFFTKTVLWVSGAALKQPQIQYIKYSPYSATNLGYSTLCHNFPRSLLVSIR